MRGRKLFKITYPLLVLLSIPLYLLPKNLVSIFWTTLDLLPGIIGVGLRYVFALRLVKSLGKNVFIGRCVEITGWNNLSIKNNVSIHKDCYINAKGGLYIGNDVSIAHSTSILTFEHTWDDKSLPIRSNPLKFSKVSIEDNVWIGCGCRILSGVTIETFSVIAAGAVVNNNVKSGTLNGGVPAKILKYL